MVVRMRLCSSWSCSKHISDREKCCHSDLQVSWHQRTAVFGTARSKTGEEDDAISLHSKRCLWMEPFFERLQHWQPQDKPLLSLNYEKYLFLFRQTCKNLWYQIKAATLELRWTGPKKREHWNPYINADGGGRPNLYDATKRADVSTKAGQSSLHWSRRIASIATTLLPSVLLHGHDSLAPPRLLRLSCFFFSALALICNVVF